MGRATFAAAAIGLACIVAGEASGREISGRRTFSGDVIVPKGETWWEGEETEADREAFIAGGAPFGAGGESRGDFRPREGAGPGSPSGGPSGKNAGRTGTFDFRGNDWGELQSQVDRGGNMTGIHDGRDEPLFEYKGKRYRMDTVLLK